ncbi:MAG: TIGR00725 family protein [Actinomycetota bacterium]
MWRRGSSATTTSNSSSNPRPYIAVIGAGENDRWAEELAEKVGAELAGGGAVLVCGGLGGVMEAACRGAKKAGGTTVGILPDAYRERANEFVDVAVATGMGEARNTLIVRTVDAVIAIGGGFGTLSEIGFALKTNKPVVGLGTWDLAKEGMQDPIARASTAGEAVARALDLAGRG